MSEVVAGQLLARVGEDGLERGAFELELSLERTRARGEMVGDSRHGAIAGRQRFVQRRADALDGAGSRVQVREPPAELGCKEPPHWFAFGHERTGSISGGEADGFSRPFARAYAEILAEPARVGG